MTKNTEMEKRLFLNADMPAVQIFPFAGGTAAVFTTRGPDSGRSNEDSAGVISLGKNRGVLIVADGAGGHSGGEKASCLAVECMAKALSTKDAEDKEIRTLVLAGFDAANKAIQKLGLGAGTTLALAEIANGRLRTYHCGDSLVLVVGNQGKLKSSLVSHSPVGYAVESGLLTEEEGIRHDERHVVSNLVGTADMKIDLGNEIEIAPRDTVLLASDGVFDNALPEKITEVIRKGSLKKAAQSLVELCRRRMANPPQGRPPRRDDLTLILYRRMRRSL